MLTVALQIRANQIKLKNSKWTTEKLMKSDDMLVRIRALVEERRYIITTHALIRMSGRDVTTKDLISLIANGEIIEQYPNRQPCPAALMLGFISSKACHVVVAICGDRLSVITVYWPDDECWINCRTRRI